MSAPPPDLPKAKIRRRPRFAPVWIIPVLAAIASGVLIYTSLQQSGPLITIVFDNSDGIQPNQTILKYQGVRVGEVRSVTLTKDLQQVVVAARLLHFAAALARDGSQFWIVRPEVGPAGLHGLDTLVSGPYIQAQPGHGAVQRNFIGLAEAPVSVNLAGKYEVVVSTPQINTLSGGSPVYYRGIEVGEVSYFALANDAQTVNVHLLIETNYAPLVRLDTKFWNAGGVSVRLKLLGISMSAENFKSLLIGGVAFATPTQPGPPAPSGTQFTLYEKSDSDWLKWSPAIPVSSPQTGGKNANASPSTLLNDVDAAGK